MSINFIGFLLLVGLGIFSVVIQFSGMERDELVKRNKVTCSEEGIVETVTCSGQFGDCRMRLTNQKVLDIRYLNPLQGEKIFLCKHSEKITGYNDYYSLTDDSTLK